MNGTTQGNVIAILYFLLFQTCGLLMAEVLLKTEQKLVRRVGGSVLGSVLLQWMPVLFAFAMDFTVAAHCWAGAVTVVVTAVMVCKGKPRLSRNKDDAPVQLPYGIIPVAVWCVFAWLVLSGLEFRDGAVWSSQATYGDMSMHLGFITSIAEQQTFPPEYSILPGTRLSYPFLSDSISSSLYLWGASLRLAYCLPMLFAGAQVMLGAWLLLRGWLVKPGRTLFAWVLYFLNGGLGILYLPGDGLAEKLQNTLTAFYETPTNYVEENIRWVNMIVDMLLPQRATLFGYAVLFFAIYLLYRGVWQGENRLFPMVGILGGALPMIHTHSFLALVLVSGCWLMAVLARDCGMNRAALGKGLLLLGMVGMQTLQLIVLLFQCREGAAYLLLTAVCGVIFAGVLIWLLQRFSRETGWGELADTWGLYLLIATVLSVPQLMIWTFGQATGEQFLRGYFNWANLDDGYLWFYLKNMGVSVLLFVCGWLTTGDKNRAVAFPVLVIWLIAELVVFQPNVYDNNKLLYVAYLFLCGVAAEFAAEVRYRIRSTPAKVAATAMIVGLCTMSAVVTVAREWVADYQLIGTEQVKLAEYISRQTQTDDIILTDTRHNNAVAVLTGRSIVCGSSSYLYYHGLDYKGNETAAEIMYEDPTLYPEIYEQFGVDYILVSSYERSSYEVDEATIAERFPCVYESGDVRLYRVE